jgi:hypothetical protein
MEASRRRHQARPVADWDLARWWRIATIPMRTAVVASLAFGLMLGLLMGWTMLPPANGKAGHLTSARADSLKSYSVDYLGNLPDDSLAGIYIALMTEDGALPIRR